MNKDAVASIIRSGGFEIISDEPMKTGYGDTLRISNGCILNIYNSGKLSYQGKNTEPIKALIEGTSSAPKNRKVFVVYGHDEVARTQLEAMLRRWDLEPLILDQLESSGNTIIEKLEEYMPQADFGIVLATPDDVGFPKNKEERLAAEAKLAAEKAAAEEARKAEKARKEAEAAQQAEKTDGQD